MNNQYRLAVVAMLLALLAIPASAIASNATPPRPQSLNDYAYHWPIELSDSTGAQRIELTPEIYRALTSRELKDLAVFDARGVSVPVSMLPEQLMPRARSEWLRASLGEPWKVSMENKTIEVEGEAAIKAGIHADGSMMVELRAPTPGERRILSQESSYELDVFLPNAAPDAHLNGIEIEWEGSVQGRWHLYRPQSHEIASLWVSEDLRIAPDDRGTRHRNTLNLDHPWAKRLYLVARGVSSDFRILSVRLRSSMPVYDEQWRFVHVPLKTREPQAHGVVHWAFESDGLYPVSKVQLGLPLGSAYELQIANRLGTGKQAFWNHSSYSAFALQTADGEKRDAGIAVNPSRDRQWRVIAKQEDLSGVPVQLFWRAEHLLFLPRGTPPFTLAAGLRGAEFAQFPVFEVMQKLREAEDDPVWLPVPATLGLMRAGAGESARKPPPPDQRAKHRQWLLWGILGVGALLITLMAVKLLGTPASTKEGE